MKTFLNLTIITFFSFFCTLSTHAHYPKVSWHTGKIILNDKNQLEGEIAYNWLAEMVMIRQTSGRMSTLSADQVLQFGWFDYNQHTYRNFLSLPASATENTLHHAFFEVCMDGPLSVVRRLKQRRGLFKRAFGHPSNYTDQPAMAQNTDHFDYYVHDAGRLLPMARFYTEVYERLMAAYDQPLQRYVQTHNINSRVLAGQLVLVDHYNFLVQQDARTASAKSYESAPN
ncbi:hypothetical protein [Spirosoma sp.]|uniref:hypothetical protein n=1 Tax=Spirosoma sp. TaxID=1899569 RepID=UPI003B3BBF2D